MLIHVSLLSLYSSERFRCAHKASTAIINAKNGMAITVGLNTGIYIKPLLVGASSADRIKLGTMILTSKVSRKPEFVVASKERILFRARDLSRIYDLKAAPKTVNKERDKSRTLNGKEW